MQAVVVDSEPSVRELVRLSLESAGYRVLEAADADEGHRLIEEHLESLRLVVMAVELPGETVGHVLRELAALRPPIPALGIARTRDRARSPDVARPFPILEPPFSAEQLGAAIEEARALAVQAAGEARVESGSKPRTCPACGSTRAMPVAYGVASTEMMEAFAAGRVALGGVRESPGSPHWRCRDCDRTWSDAAQGPPGSR